MDFIPSQIYGEYKVAEKLQEIRASHSWELNTRVPLSRFLLKLSDVLR